VVFSNALAFTHYDLPLLDRRFRAGYGEKDGSPYVFPGDIAKLVLSGEKRVFEAYYGGKTYGKAEKNEQLPVLDLRGRFILSVLHFFDSSSSNRRAS